MAEDRKLISPTRVKCALFIGRDSVLPRKVSQEVLQECVFSVWINGVLSLKMVCTPTDLEELVLGHLLSEGSISERCQVKSIAIDQSTFSAKVVLDMQDTTRSFPLEIRACDCGASGILGRAEIDAWEVSASSELFSWNPEEIFLLADAFREQTPIYRMTKGIHSCLLLYEGKIRYCCEDIGRHNALDKIIGHAMMDGLDLSRCIVYSSGRIPEDMIAKVIRSGIPVLASKATPTARAVELARQHHVTLICGAHPDGFKVFSCPELWNPMFSAGILAGGNSSRMGSNKVLLDRHGITFLSHIQKQCAFLPETIISLGRGNQIPGLRANCVWDEKDQFGPLEGIYQLLRAAKHEYVLILAADMQGLNQCFLKRFLRQFTPEFDCMILKSVNGPEPLCGVYSKAVLPILEEMRRQDMRRPRSLFDCVKTRYVTAFDLNMTEETLGDFINNINTPDDYRAFLNKGL